MAAVTQRKLTELHDRLIGVRAGSIEVTDAKVELQFDHSAEEYVEVTLVLSEPPAGQDTWPLDDAYELLQNVRRIASEDLDISEYLAIVFGASARPNVEAGDDDGDEADGEAG